jgi:hypothetical protein
MNRPVSVGNVRPMSGGNSSIPTPPPVTEEEERRRRVENIVRGTGAEAFQNPFNFGNFLDPIGENFRRNQALISGASAPAKSVAGRSAPGFVPNTPQIYGLAGQTAGIGIPGQPRQREETFEEFAASFLGGGGGASRPDFSAYRAALTDQAQQINAQIQAMYNALGEEAGANVGRIQEIYGGAEQGIGNVYNSATGNVADAFGSAQQQAADQMARLGIEAAAPAVIDPMALAQAQAVSGLEQGRASGQAAAQRFGASAGGFGSQMAQVAQQQGTEMNAAILASLQNRLMDSLAAEQSGGGGGGGGMSVRDQLALREAFESRGQLPLDERKFAFDVAQAAARPANEYSQWQRDKFVELTTPQRGQKPLFTPEEAQAYLNAVESSLGAG